MKRKLFILLFCAASFIYGSETDKKESSGSKWDCEIYAAPVYKSKEVKSKYKDISFNNFGVEFGVETVNKISNKVYKANVDICKANSNLKNLANENFTGASYSLNLGFGYNFKMSQKTNLSLLGIYELNYIHIRCPVFYISSEKYLQEISIIENDVGLNLNYRLNLNSKLSLFNSFSILYGLGGMLSLSDDSAGYYTNYLWDCKKGGLEFNCALGLAYYF